MDHQVEEFFDFGLEAVGFLGCIGRHKIFLKARGVSDAPWNEVSLYEPELTRPVAVARWGLQRRPDDTQQSFQHRQLFDKKGQTVPP